MRRNANAFRVIDKRLEQYYISGEVDKIPFLEGKNNIDEEGYQSNNFNYNLEERYLHFFENPKHAEYFMSAKTGLFPDGMVILAFNLPEELIRRNTYKGLYYSVPEMGDAYWTEYIIPASKYKSSYCLGEAIEEDFKGRVSYDPDSYAF